MRRLAGLLTCLAITACGPQIQTTSGQAYLASYEDAVSRPDDGVYGEIDARVREAANAEPILRFPARLGLARIVNGVMTAIPPEEAAMWRDAIGRHGGLGTFHVVSPLIAGLAGQPAQAKRIRWYRYHVDEIVRTIRIGAARQHLDAVLIYEVGARAHKSNTVFALADVTIIGGAILPTRSIKAEGIGHALLLDVRNGYPYGTASAQADLSTLYVSWGSDRRTEEAHDEAILKVVQKLIPDVETMITDLARALPASGAPSPRDPEAGAGT